MPLSGPLERMRTGWGALSAAVAWNVFDVAVHVVANRVEPPRIAGNVAVLIAFALSWAALRRRGGRRLAAVACGIGAGVHLALNLAWVAANGELPIPAAIFIFVSLGLVVWAGWRFLEEGLGSEALGDAT